jgi:hypothetical protein
LALSFCDEGLDELGEAYRDYGDHWADKCLFLTLKGKALGLLGEFRAAFETFDRALAIAGTRPGRYNLPAAITTLYCAETLLFYSDQLVMASCLASAKDQLGIDQLSPAGAFFLALEESYRGAPSIGSQTRRAVTPWVGHHKSGTQDQLSEKISAALRLIDDIESSHGKRGKKVEDLEQKLTKVVAATQKLSADHSKITDSTFPFYHSLAYWNPELLRRVEAGDEAQTSRVAVREALRKARRELFRARDALDRGELLLAGSRRNLKYLFLLHQLRAELSFESLLLHITNGPSEEGQREDEEGTRDRRVEQNGVGEDLSLRKYYFVFLEEARAGLRSIRDALDCRLQFNEASSNDPRFIRLKRLWSQFMVVCVCNAVIRYQLSPTKTLNNDELCKALWERWTWLNSGAGLIWDDPKSAPDNQDRRKKVWFIGSDKIRSFQEYSDLIVRSCVEEVREFSLVARAFVERHLKPFVDPQSTEILNAPIHSNGVPAE